MTDTNNLIEAAEQALRMRCQDEAIVLFDQAEQAGADLDRCAAGRWTAYMLQHDFGLAWVQSDAIRARNATDPHRFWQGEALAGKCVMLRCLHGLGDAVQFLRYMPRLQAIAARVIVQVPPNFTELAACFHGVDDVITWGEDLGVREPDWDVQIEIMELPYIFRTEVSELPIATRYLDLPGQMPARRPHFGKQLQVGLVWTAGEWNAARSIPHSLLTHLIAVEGCEFWNLHPVNAVSEHKTLLEDENCQRSVCGLAERIASLDLVITVDTLAAHLAGAMDVPAWVILQHEADWRWMHARDDSPWYPSLRLFRQQTPGDWYPVIAAVAEELRLLARTFADERLVA